MVSFLKRRSPIKPDAGIIERPQSPGKPLPDDCNVVEYASDRRVYVLSGPQGDPDGLTFILFHGGGWFAGAPFDNDSLARYLTPWGECQLVEYATYARGRATLDDAVADAIAFAAHFQRTHADRKCVLIGLSAGATLALWAARALKEQCVALVLLSAVTDTGPQGFRNCMVPQRGRADISPQTFVDLIRAPVLMIHANKDQSVPVVQIRSFYKALIAQRTPARLVEVDSERHDFHRLEHFSALVQTEVRDFLYARKLVDQSYPDHATAAEAIRGAAKEPPPNAAGPAADTP